MKMADFHDELARRIGVAQQSNRAHIDVTAKDLHDSLGASERMPMACAAMWREERRGGATILHETPSGQSPTLKIRYHLPRPASV